VEQCSKYCPFPQRWQLLEICWAQHEPPIPFLPQLIVAIVQLAVDAL
jgi:hypothetical protein